MLQQGGGRGGWGLEDSQTLTEEGSAPWPQGSTSTKQTLLLRTTGGGGGGRAYQGVPYIRNPLTVTSESCRYTQFVRRDWTLSKSSGLSLDTEGNR